MKQASQSTPVARTSAVRAKAMQRTLTSRSRIKWVACGVLLAVTAIIAIDAWQAWNSPQHYPFGAEGPVANLRAYQTQRHYLIAAGLALAACCLAIMGIWLRYASRRLRWLCVAPLLAMAMLTVYEWLIAFD